MSRYLFKNFSLSYREIERLCQWSIKAIRNKGVISFLKQALQFTARKLIPEKSLNAQYGIWLRRNCFLEETRIPLSSEVEKFNDKPLISILLPIGQINEGGFRKAVDSVFGQIYPYWELCVGGSWEDAEKARNWVEQYSVGDSRIKVITTNDSIPSPSNAALSLAEGDFVALMAQNDEMSPEALYEVVKYLNDYPDCDLIYCDEDRVSALVINDQKVKMVIIRFIKDGRYAFFKQMDFIPGWNNDGYLGTVNHFIFHPTGTHEQSITYVRF